MYLLFAVVLSVVTPSQDDQELMGLYADDYIRGMARRDVDADILVGIQKGLTSQPILDVVPAGKSKPVSEIFEELNLDLKRAPLLKADQLNNVVFLEFCVSPSYVMSIMTDARKFESIEDKRDFEAIEGYGVRILAGDR